MNLFKITLYPALKDHFFDLPYNINCNAREYVGCSNVKKYFDIERVEREELVDVGLGVKISRPINIEGSLKGDGRMFSSLSHRGVLAISYHADGCNVQLTDLVNKRQIEIEVENSTHTGFFDNSMVMLTYGKPLRVCSVEGMFSKRDVSVLKSVGDMEVLPFTDVSLFHSTRTLIFTSTSFIPYEFDVDTTVVRKLNIGKKIWSLASLTGIDIGVKGMFVENGNNYFTYSLNNDNSASLVLKRDFSAVNTFLPSSSDPNDLKKGMKINIGGSFSTKTTNGAHLVTPLKHQDWRSIVRLYQDIFLAYDANNKKWSVVKILVP